jgi:hypothetical protein
MEISLQKDISFPSEESRTIPCSPIILHVHDSRVAYLEVQNNGVITTSNSPFVNNIITFNYISNEGKKGGDSVNVHEQTLPLAGIRKMTTQSRLMSLYRVPTQIWRSSTRTN